MDLEDYVNVESFYYLWAALLVLVNAAAWATTCFTLPGNWVAVLLTAAFAAFVPAGPDQGIGWGTVAIAAGLAAAGEVVELAAGAAGAARYGASRRATLLALLGTLGGSIAGAIVCAPIPLIGLPFGAIGGGALGAFAGAYLGEIWKGKAAPERLSVGRGAMLGRLLGTVGKLALGAVLCVLVAIDAFV